MVAVLLWLTLGANNDFLPYDRVQNTYILNLGPYT